MCLLNKKRIIVYLLSFIYFSLSSNRYYANTFNDLRNNSTNNIFCVDIPDYNIKSFITKNGNEVLSKKGYYDDISILNDINNSNDYYFFEYKKEYVGESYYLGSYYYDAATKINLYTRDGIYLCTMIDEITNKEICPLFHSNNKIFYLIAGWDITTEIVEELSDFTKYPVGYSTDYSTACLVTDVCMYNTDTGVNQCICTNHKYWIDFDYHKRFDFIDNDFNQLDLNTNVTELEKSTLKDILLNQNVADIIINKTYSFSLNEFCIDGVKYSVKDNKVYNDNKMILNLYKKKLYGISGNYLVVADAFNYGLIDIHGQWFYKRDLWLSTDCGE